MKSNERGFDMGRMHRAERRVLLGFAFVAVFVLAFIVCHFLNWRERDSMRQYIEQLEEQNREMELKLERFERPDIEYTLERGPHERT